MTMTMPMTMDEQGLRLPLDRLRIVDGDVGPAVTDEEIADDLEETQQAVDAVGSGMPDESRFTDVLPALPTNRNGVLAPEFMRYYLPPWTPLFFDYDDPFNDLIVIYSGPRGGGKSISAVATNIIDGQMKGIPCVSNFDFAWVAKDSNGKLYKIVSLPFDQDQFATGDMDLKYKRLLLDEGNYLADRMRSTSNKNMSMVDILQQARKFRMCVTFCTINWLWLDPRVTGDLLDLLVKCNDCFYKPYGRANGLRKGHRIAWDVWDMSGKLSGRQNYLFASRTFNARAMWGTFDTENFVDPVQARKKLKQHEKTIIDENGFEVKEQDWYDTLHTKLKRLSEAQPEWLNEELWPALGLDRCPRLKIQAGKFIRGLGISKRGLFGGRASYDLSEGF